MPIYAENSSSMKTERCSLDLVCWKLLITSAEADWGSGWGNNAKGRDGGGGQVGGHEATSGK